MEDNESSLSHIFKAYDIRGKVPSELSPQLSERVGLAFSNWLNSTGPVVIGRDMRPDSKDLADAMIEGILKTGRDVVDIGMVTSDMAVFAVKHLRASGAAIITASHNPGEYNGIKLYDDTPKTIGLDQGLDEIRDAALKSEKAQDTTKGVCSTKDLTDAWIDFCLEFIDVKKLRPLHVVIDTGNGMAGAILPKLLAKLPFSVTELFFELDGTFPNHQANPQNLDTLRDLQEVVAKEHAAIGIAFDGDGDRMAMVDENGKPVTGSEMMSLLASKYASLEDPSFVYEVRTSRTAVKRLEATKFRGVRSKAGRSNIGEVMRDNDAVFGGETTGHFFFKDYWFNDSGLISMLIALEVICSQDQPLSEFITTHHKTDLMIAETNFEVADADAVINEVKNRFSEYTQDSLDGLSVIADSWWLNLRKSNTEPLIRLNAEAADSTKLHELVDTISGIANQ